MLMELPESLSGGLPFGSPPLGSPPFGSPPFGSPPFGSPWRCTSVQALKPTAVGFGDPAEDVLQDRLFERRVATERDPAECRRRLWQRIFDAAHRSIGADRGDPFGRF